MAVFQTHTPRRQALSWSLPNRYPPHLLPARPSSPSGPQALAILVDEYGRHDARVAFALHNLGGFYLAEKKLGKAAEAYEEVGASKLCSTAASLRHCGRARRGCAKQLLPFARAPAAGRAGAWSRRQRRGRAPALLLLLQRARAGLLWLWCFWRGGKCRLRCRPRWRRVLRCPQHCGPPLLAPASLCWAGAESEDGCARPWPL